MIIYIRSWEICRTIKAIIENNKPIILVHYSINFFYFALLFQRIFIIRMV
ncbi:hypothetical protein Scep_029765 [Stephania cephalantha]|uniref:Uncharacterized protein n=1 Tax=Stephania cephalantha TaxID=152367 RepID=A0AAP0HDT2_9MAGN